MDEEMLKTIEELHKVFLEIVPFCRAASNPQVEEKLVEAELLFTRLEEDTKHGGEE